MKRITLADAEMGKIYRGIECDYVTLKICVHGNRYWADAGEDVIDAMDMVAIDGNALSCGC